jgi:cytochrome c oxidase subunit 3
MATETDRPGEPATRGEGAEGFPHGSKYPFVVGMGMMFTGWGLMWAPVLIVGVPVLLWGVWGWTREYAIEEFERGVIPEQKRQLLGVETGLIGMYVLIVSEILVFMGFFVAWFYLDATRGPFPPEGYPGLSLTMGAAMTLVMLAGSATALYGRNAVLDDDRSGLVRGYAATFLAGVVFLVLLGVEYSRLAAAGLLWTTGPYGASYYGLTGLHGAHLLGGLALVGVVLYRTVSRGHFSSSRNLMVRTTEAYWHFLTAVSIAILVFVYYGA